MTFLSGLTKRPITLFLSLVIVVVSLLVISQYDVPSIPAKLCTTYQEVQSSSSSWSSSSDPSTESTMERIRAFKASFPKLRSTAEQGFPAITDDNPDHKPPFDWPTTTHMFAFGDSFTQDVHYRIREDGMGNGRPETTWHLDYGMIRRTWADWLYGMFKDFRSMQFYNLARAGATVSYDVVPPGNPDWGTYEDQLQDFEDFFCPAPGPDSVNWHPDHTIFMVFMGINDLAQLQRRDEGDIERCEKVARALFDNSSILHKLGARNFLFLNAHAYYRSPKFLLDQYFGVEQPRVINSVKYFNEAFALEVEAFRRRHPDANVMDFDLYRFVDLILDEPELFGLTETERFEMRWEGQPEEQESDNGEFGFAFRDFQHLSWSVHLLIARSLNGLLMRHSTSLTRSNATDEGFYVQSRPAGP